MKFADVSRNCQNIQSRDNPKRKFGDGAETVKISRLALSPNSSLGMDETFCLKYKLASSPNSSLGISTRPKLKFGDFYTTPTRVWGFLHDPNSSLGITQVWR